MKFCARHHTAYDGVCMDCAAMGASQPPRVAGGSEWLEKLHRSDVALLVKSCFPSAPPGDSELSHAGYARLPTKDARFEPIAMGGAINAAEISWTLAASPTDPPFVVGMAFVLDGTCLIQGPIAQPIKFSGNPATFVTLLFPPGAITLSWPC